MSQSTPPTFRATPVVAALLVAALLAGQASGAAGPPSHAGAGPPSHPGTEPPVATAAPDATGAAPDCESPDRYLVVADADTGARLLSVPVCDGTAVSLRYTHSVERTPVVDGYEVRGDRLVMVRMEFASYGAGLPAGAAVNRTADGAFVFDPPGAYRELYVRPGHVAGHVLDVGGVRVDLVALSDAGAVRVHLVPARDVTVP